MSASSVILRGYKGGTLVTRGYSVGEAVAPVVDTPTGGWVDPPGWRRRKPEHEPEVKRKIIARKIITLKPATEPEKKPDTVHRSIVEGLFAPSAIELKPLPYEDDAARAARIMAIERRREEEILILLLALA